MRTNEGGLEQAPSDPPAAAARKEPWPLHSQQLIAAQAPHDLQPQVPLHTCMRDALSFKLTRRTHPAGRSGLELAGRWLRWGRAGG